MLWTVSAQLIAGLLLTALVGASLGVLGAGGSIIMLPVLVYVVGVDPHAAVPLSLAVVGTTSLLSAAVRSRNGEIKLRAAALFGGAALLGAFFGSRLTYLVPAAVLLLLFGLLLVIVGVRMWREARREESGGPRTARPLLTALAGGGVGVLTGFLGVGGGFLIVPALMHVAGLTIRQAVSTSLVVIALSSAAGFAAHLVHGATVSAAQALPLVLAAAIGMGAGMLGARRVTSHQLRRGFAGFVTVVGSALVMVNAPAALRILR
jgi:uncharacterized membrane protein YfcA